MSAYDDVIERDDCRERAYSENYGKGAKACRDEGQPEHIGLARAPITIKQPGGALPINVARPMDACRNNLGHRCKVQLSIAPARAGKFFLKRRPPRL